MGKGLKIVLPSAVSDPEGKLRKLEHYYGVEFLRGASNGGGNAGYYRLIGDETLMAEMRFHNQMKIASVKDASLQYIYNQINWNQSESGASASVNGSDGADVIQLHTQTVYAIIGGTNTTYERFIVSDAPFTYDGDEAIAFEPMGDSPDYVTIKDNKSRSIYDENVIGTQNAANAAVTNLGTSGLGVATANGGFPRTVLSRYAYEAYARAKNANTAKNSPYAPYNNFDLELLQAFMFIEFRTKQLNNFLGHGISSNVIPTEATWGKVTGARITFDGGSSYTYAGFNTIVYPTKGAAGINLWKLLNNYSPLLKVFEVQRAVSNGASLEAVKNADGENVQGISDGVMTGIYTKTFSIVANISLTQSGDPVTANIDFVLRVPVWRGRTRLWGHLYQHTSGYDVLRYNDGEKLVHELYRAKSIEGLMTDSDETQKTTKGQFAFEQTYDAVGAFGVGGYGTKQLTHNGVTLGITADAPSVAGRDNYESSGVWGDTAPLSTGIYQRKCALFGISATAATCVFRSANVAYAPSGALSHVGSGLHVTLQD